MSTNLTQSSTMRLKPIYPVMLFTKTSSTMFLVAKITFFLSWFSYMVIVQMMFRLGSKFKILNPIIKFIVIDVVDYLCRFKITSKVFLHYKTVLKDIPITLGVGMIRSSYQIISRGGYILTTLPSIMLFSRRHIFNVTFSAKSSFRTSLHICYTRILNQFTTLNAFSVNHNLIITKG